jgi:hypothetical protein
VLEHGQRPDIARRHARDAQVVDHDERAEAAAHGDERHVDHGKARRGHQLVAPDAGVLQGVGERTDPVEPR